MRRAARRVPGALVAVLLVGCVAEYQASPAPLDGSTGESGESDAMTQGGDAPTEGDETAPEESETAEPECGVDELLCDGACIEPAWDHDHCGDCFEACLLDTMCIDGECVRPCGSGCDPETSVCDQGVCRCRPEMVNCNGLCVYAAGDPEHCGECWQECPEEAPVCGDYDCEEDCSTFPDACDGTCTDFSDDPFHCGGCDVVCDSDEICVDAECVGYTELDPVQCDECPCPESCDTLCCWSTLLDTNVCIDGGVCPPE